LPRAGAGNQVSSTVPADAPSVTTVARTQPCALVMLTGSVTGGRLLALAAVDALAEEVGMAAVARVLLDHVDDDLPHLRLVAGGTDQHAHLLVPVQHPAG